MISDSPRSLQGWNQRMVGNPISSASVFADGETYTEELEKDTSEGPIVGRECIGLSSKNLRRHAVCQLPSSPSERQLTSLEIQPPSPPNRQSRSKKGVDTHITRFSHPHAPVQSPPLQCTPHDEISILDLIELLIISSAHYWAKFS